MSATANRILVASILTLFAGSQLIPLSAQAAGVCSLLFKTSQKSSLFSHLNNEQLLSHIHTESTKFNRGDLSIAANQIRTRLNGNDALTTRLLRESLENLADFSNARTQDLVTRINLEIEKHGTQNLEYVLEQTLQPFFTEAQARARVNDFASGRSRLNDLQGNFSHEKMLEHIMGSKPGEISADSLLGRFLVEANRIGEVTVEKRSFEAFETGVEGPERFFIAIDTRHFDLYMRYFSDSHLLTHLHNNGQGTMMIANNGRSGTYARAQENIRPQSPGALWPSIVLSSREANRMRLFNELAAVQSNSAMYPWTLGKINLEARTFEPYSAKGYFTCCTHWFGNIPVGEKTTDSYLFPQADNGTIGTSKVLTEYDVAFDGAAYGPENINWSNAGSVQPAHPYAKLVWTVPGHQQLWEVLGLRESQVSGELANPGFVLYSLLSKAPADRVPFVFYTAHSSSNSIPSNEVLRTYIRPN